MQCTATRKSDGKPCEAYAVKGEDKCRMHLGKKGDSHDDNQNAVSHGLYAECNKFYQNTLSDAEQALVDEIFQDYCTAYRERNAVTDIPTGIQARLFEISVNHAKVLYSDNWLTEKPDELDSGNAIVDKETKYTEDGKPYHKYKETVVNRAQNVLRREDRLFLRDVNLLDTPEDKVAEGIGQLAVEIRHQTIE